MRRTAMPQVLLAAVLALALAASISGLFGATGVSIKITSPAAGAKVSGVLTITASVRGARDVSYVVFGVDGDRPHSTNSEPYSFQLDTTVLTNGPHRIFAEAYDDYGLIASSKVITISVRNRAASVAQAKKAPPAQLAEKPATPPSPTPATPTAPPAPATVAAAAQSERAAVPSSTMLGRAAAAEPSHVPAGAPQPLAAPPSPAEEATRASFAAAAPADLAPPARPLPRLRGHTVVLNGHPVQFTVAPYVLNGRMQVGLRAMFEGIGARVFWLSQIRTARSIHGPTRVDVPADSRMAKVNGQPVDMGTPASIRQARLIIPLGFFATVTGAAVHWDQQIGLATVTVGPRTLAEQP